MPAAAQVSDDVVKLAITNDQSSIYSAAGGYGVVIAAQMAVEDFGGTVLGKKIEVVFADNQNKPDVGVGIVNRWLDTDHVDVIVDGGSSAVGMAVQAVTREKNKLFLIIASGTATTLAKQGLDSWFFITADYTFGQVLEAQAGEIAQRYGAKVLGSVRAPFNTADFSSFLLQAKASNAKVVALANAGGDASTSIKQAHEFGLMRGGQKLAALFLNITDVHALGLDTAQGLVVTTSFYWDRTDASRAFGKRFLERAKNAPTFLQAGAYSAVTHYLKAVKEAGTDATGPVAAQMKKMKINDPMTENGWIREDGRVMRDFYVVQIKAPAESKAPWDYYKIIGKVAADDAALPLSRSACKLVQK